MSERRPVFSGSIVQIDAAISSNTGKPVARLQVQAPGDRTSIRAISVGLDRAVQLADDLAATARALRAAFDPGAVALPVNAVQPSSAPAIPAPAAASATPGKPAQPKPTPVVAAPKKRESLAFGSFFGRDRALRAVEIILHIGDGAGAEYHVDLWLPYLRNSGATVLLVVRSLPVMDKLAEQPGIDVVYVKEGRDAETLVASCANLKAIFYTSNTGNVIHFVRFNHLTHVFLGHGDSEKAASCHKFFRVYDEIWTAGQAHVDRFTNSGVRFPGLQTRIVGRPQMRAALQSAGPATAGTFLFLPTWEGFHHEQNYSSLPIAPPMIAAVAELTARQPRVKFHPWTGKQSTTSAYNERGFVASYGEAASPPQMLDRAIPATEFMTASDFLITDISSVISDYLVIGRPIFMYVPADEAIRTAASHVTYTEYVYVFSTAEELLTLVRQVIIDGQDDLAPARRKALSYFVDVERTLDDTFEAEVRRVVADQSGDRIKAVETDPEHVIIHHGVA